jgi:hypothetical protein
MLSTAIIRGERTDKRALARLRYLCGPVIAALVLLPAVSFAAPGDFNGDGMADVLWQNSQTGQIYIWEMNGTTIASVGSVATLAPSTGWVIQGVGDFNGDGKADILFQNSTSGEVYIWLMNGMTIIGQGTPGTEAPGSGWSIEGVGDFNGDGDADILWQNNQTGQTYIWLMNGVNLASDASAGSATPDWSVAPVYTYACSESYGSDVCPITPAINAVRTNGPFPGGPNVWGPSTGTPNPAPSPALSPLTWSPLAATNAQAWATQCNYGHNPDLNTAGFGENIYAAWARRSVLRQAMG